MATSDLTVLLVTSDSTLLADEEGGRVPTLTWCYSEITDVDRWARPSIAMRPHEGIRAATGLLLAHNGALVAMGWDRFRRVWRGGGAAPFANPEIYEVIAYANAFAQDKGAHVVLLRDGREVAS